MAPGELRQDPLSGRWVAITTGRAARPEAFLREEGPGRGPLGCPFCPGNEHMTPPEVWADRDSAVAAGIAAPPKGRRGRLKDSAVAAGIAAPPKGRRGRLKDSAVGGGAAAPPEGRRGRLDDGAADGPGWRVRVVPNKFPAFAGPAGASPEAGDGPGGLYRAAPTAGAHEVIIHNPDHAATLADLDEPDAARVTAAWRLRLAARHDDELGAAVVVVNQGRLSGASLEHPHSQMFATVARPALVQAELERLGRDDCAACAILNKERGGERVVADAAGLVTLCPWASALPFEALILPDQHLPRLDDPGPGDLALAGALGGLLRGLDAAVGARAPYNLVLHAAPPGTDDFHWHLHLLPRLTTYGGFELGTGIVINVVDPDRAAADLRSG